MCFASQIRAYSRLNAHGLATVLLLVNPMRKAFTLLLLIPLLSLANTHGTLIPTAMFENSVRRDAYPQEKQGIVRVITNFGKYNGRCTGYFVKNADNRFFIASAQHCANYDFAKFCKAGSISITTASGNHKGSCENVIISYPYSDFVIFEARFANPDEVLRSVEFLTMSSSTPPGGTSLKLIGYPGDEERKGQLTVSEKCSVVKTNRTAMQEMKKEDFELLKGKQPAKPAPKQTVAPQKPREPNPEVELQKRRAADIKKYAVKKLHNCSVYGGNSGGPLLIHGTTTVIGMPMNYIRLPVTREFSKDSGMHFETTQSFILRNQLGFDTYRIITTNNIFGMPF